MSIDDFVNDPDKKISLSDFLVQLRLSGIDPNRSSEAVDFFEKLKVMGRAPSHSCDSKVALNNYLSENKLDSESKLFQAIWRASEKLPIRKFN